MQIYKGKKKVDSIIIMFLNKNQQQKNETEIKNDS